MKFFIGLLLWFACASDESSDKSTTSAVETNTNTEADDSGADDTTDPDDGEQPITYPELAVLDSTITELMAEGHVPGLQASLVADGQVRWSKGYGLADAVAGTEVTVDHSFMLASISKTVTAVALMQLYDDGAFDLDDPIGDYLDFQVVHPEHDEAITFRHLLTHTSSINDNWTVMNLVYVDGDSEVVLGDFLSNYLDPDGQYYNADLHFHGWVPGEAFDYSNIGIALVGHLVEQLADMDFSDWCQLHIFDPLQMHHTGWHLADLDVQLVASPHEREGGEYVVIPHYGYADYPDGQLRSSAQDMGRFLAMFAGLGSYQDTRILTADTVTEMQRIQLPAEGQGLVWYETSIAGRAMMGHGGSDIGVRTKMFVRLDDGVGFVLLLNRQVDADILRQLQVALLDAADTELAPQE